MKINAHLHCAVRCSDVRITKYFPEISCDPTRVKLVMVSEAIPDNVQDYFYEKGDPAFLRTTVQAFADAGFAMNTVKDFFDRGIYLTTALKCKKKEYLVSSGTLQKCASVLQEELEQFLNIRVIMLMGDFAIRTMNYIWKNKYNKRAISAGSTYKIRKAVYEDRGIRFFPSYTQTGDSFNIEKSKRRMIAEDIDAAMKLII